MPEYPIQEMRMLCSALASGTGLAETDPQVGMNSMNYLSKWNGTALISSSVFESGGNVGIGTASPSAKLDVVSPMRITR